MRIILSLFFLLGLIYLILPGPEKIEEFPRLPGSLKSQLPGDTVQNPNIAAYFSDYDRPFVTGFYKKEFNEIYCKKNILGIPNPLCFIAPIKLIHPPEKAFNYIRDQQESTYLEEYLFPMRESLFVNGYEPIYRDGRKFNYKSLPLEMDGNVYFSKATVRYYPSSVWSRVIVYGLVWVSLTALFRLGRRVIKYG